MWNGHAQPRQRPSRGGFEEVAEMASGHKKWQVDRIDACRDAGSIVHDRTQAVANRVSNHTIDLGCGRNGIVAIPVSEF